MDNMKTGAFIKARRKELDLTQRQLAEHLHVTDRAVSKWERGLCAPDIALLELLAETLQVSVVELLEGERRGAEDREGEERARTVLRYSGQEIRRRAKRMRKMYLGILLALLAFLMVGVWEICRSGWPFVIDRIPSPDGTVEVVVYSKELESGGFSLRDATSLIIDHGENKGSTRISYGNCTYRGLWWAPDGRKYVVALEDYGGEAYLALAWLDRHVESNLNAYLSMGVATTELQKYGYTNEKGWPDIEYQFLQWSADSAAMLIYYSFEDGTGMLHEGYFWYFCESGEVRSILELEP